MFDSFDSLFLVIVAICGVYAVVQGIYHALGKDVDSVTNRMWFGKKINDLNIEKVSRTYGVMDAALGLIVLISDYMFYIGLDWVAYVACILGLIAHCLMGLYISKSDNFKAIPHN